MTDNVPAGWYPDPVGRHEHRYWDGRQWTHHVGSRGRQEVAPLPDEASTAQALSASQQAAHAPTAPATGGPSAPPRARTTASVERQVRRVGVASSIEAADEAMLNEPVLVINQKGKLFEVNAEYAVYDQRGQQLGSVREVGQSVMKKATATANRTRRLQVADANGRVLMSLTQPTKFVNAKMIVMGANGAQIGQISQSFTFTFARFRLEAGGQQVGTISGEDRNQSDFGIQDAAGDEVGRITRTGAGLMKEMFTKADSYVLEIHRPLDGPLRSLVVAAALALDTALRQR